MTTECQLRGADAVCPEPIGSGQSIAALAFMFSGRKSSRVTFRNALITFGERKMPLLTSFLMSSSHLCWLIIHPFLIEAKSELRLYDYHKKLS